LQKGLTVNVVQLVMMGGSSTEGSSHGINMLLVQ
jgi:hypothetical protein